MKRREKNIREIIKAKKGEKFDYNYLTVRSGIGIKIEIYPMNCFYSLINFYLQSLVLIICTF